MIDRYVSMTGNQMKLRSQGIVLVGLQ